MVVLQSSHSTSMPQLPFILKNTGCSSRSCHKANFLIKLKPVVPKSSVRGCKIISRRERENVQPPFARSSREMSAAPSPTAGPGDSTHFASWPAHTRLFCAEPLQKWCAAKYRRQLPRCPTNSAIVKGWHTATQPPHVWGQSMFYLVSCSSLQQYILTKVLKQKNLIFGQLLQ